MKLVALITAVVLLGNGLQERAERLLPLSHLMVEALSPSSGKETGKDYV